MLAIKLLFLLWLICGSKASNHSPACHQLQTLYQTLCHQDITQSLHVQRIQQGAPGKRGPAGQKGEMGLRGPVGPQAVVDYDRIESKVHGEISPELEQLREKGRTVASIMERLEDRIRILESREGACEIKYNDKCFWVVTLDHMVPGYDRAVSMCAERNGAPANIYSEEHYNIIMRYLRSKILSKLIAIHLWIGMRTDPATGIVTLSNGTRAPFMKWYPGNPTRKSAYTHMTIVQRVPSTVSNVGIHNWPPTATREGALCEL